MEENNINLIRILDGDYKYPFKFWSGLRINANEEPEDFLFYRNETESTLIRVNRKTIKSIEFVFNDTKTDIHSYTKSGAGEAFIGGLIAGEEGAIIGAAAGRETNIYTTYDESYIVLITFKNNKSVLIECDKKQRNKFAFMKYKLTDEECEVEEKRVIKHCALRTDFYHILYKKQKIINILNKINNKSESSIGSSILISFIFAVFLIWLNGDSDDTQSHIVIVLISFLLCILMHLLFLKEKPKGLEQLIKKSNTRYCTSKFNSKNTSNYYTIRSVEKIYDFETLYDF